MENNSHALEPRQSSECFDVDLNSLSNELILHILYFLDIKDAVHTSVLSSRWRDIWHSTLNLNIDFGLKYTDKEGAADFVKIVDWLLDIHEGLKINKFHVRFPQRIKLMRYASKVNEWIRFAINKDVGELDLDLAPDRCAIAYSLPPWIFKCKTLTSLKLKAWKVGFPDSICLSSLTTPSLKKVDMTDEFIQKALDGCLVLEELVLAKCKFLPIPLVISSSALDLQLKRLTIERCCYNTGIEIRAPKLQMFNLCGTALQHHHYRMSEMLFLKEVDLSSFYERKKHNGSVKLLLRHLCHTKVLKLSRSCLVPISTIRNMQSYKFNTRCLVLMSRLRDNELQGMIKLLESSPYVEALILDLSPSAKKTNALKVHCRETIYCMACHLKTIKITGFCREEHLAYISKKKTVESSEEMQDGKFELVHFLLENAKVLEEIVVHMAKDLDSVKREEQSKIVSMVVEKVRAIPRASSSARVIFSYN